MSPTTIRHWRELDAHERLALGGLVRALVRMDEYFSKEEAERIDRISLEIEAGSGLWDAMQEAASTLSGDAAIRAAAAQVTRPEAQAFMTDILTSVALAETISEPERQVLDFLARLWASPQKHHVHAS